MGRIFYILFLTSSCCFALAQESDMLIFEDYMSIVKNEHPVMYQARLLEEVADANGLMARGGFDPKLEADWSHKSFDDKNYYSLASGVVKVPTWYGVDVKAGYDRNSGIYVDNSDFIPERGLWYAGVSLGLGRGLVIDERRAELQQAEIFRESTQQEQVLMENNLLFDAANVYVDWQVARAYLTIADEGVALASARLQGTKSSFIGGDKPAIDTLESFISLQARSLEQQKARQQLKNARLAVSNYLWSGGSLPLELGDETKPEEIDIDLMSNDVEELAVSQEELILNHPELLLYDYKLASLDVDRRLAAEDLKPDFRVNYNPLVGVPDDGLFDDVRADNYKVGATLSYPLMQRKQRGKLQLIKLKESDTVYDRVLKQQSLLVKLDTYLNNIRQTTDQYELLAETVENYSEMLRAENRKQSLGESSIFLINSREVKYLDSRYKQIEAGRKLIFNRLTYLLYLVQMGEVF